MVLWRGIAEGTTTHPVECFGKGGSNIDPQGRSDAVELY